MLHTKNSFFDKEAVHPVEGSGALTISWSSKPKGDAVEAKKGSGVDFFLIQGNYFPLFLMKFSLLRIDKFLSLKITRLKL